MAIFAPTGLTKDEDSRRIASEGGRIVAYPFKCKHKIPHAGIAGVRKILIESTKRQVPKRIQPMVHRNYDHVTLGRQVRPVIER